MEIERITLTGTELKTLEIQHRALHDKKAADKVKTIILLSKGWTYQQIEEALLLDQRTLARYKEIYLRDGLDSLISVKYHGGMAKLSDDQISNLQKYLDETLCSTATEVCEYVKKKFHIEYKPHSMVKLLGRIGFSYKKTKALPGKADTENQKIFVGEYNELRNSLPDNDKIIFCDSVHPTYNMMCGYGWIRTGSERYVKSTEGRKHLNLVGGYCPQDQGILVRNYETVNAASIISFFKDLVKKYPEATTIHVILDNARYHHAKDVQNYVKKSRIQLVWLPSYSPNLNLIERLWKMFKEHVTYNKYYPTFEEFKEKTIKFFHQRSGSFKEKVMSLLSERFHLFPALT